MRSLLRFSLIAAFLVALAFATGCEDTPLAPGADSTMSLVANPSTLVFATKDTTLPATISAVVLTHDGVPEQGVSVLFSTTSGSLSSNGSPRETNGSGAATDTLTVPRDGPADVTVTATAGSLTQTVKVTKTTSNANHPPQAVILVTPGHEQAINLSFTLDGSHSSDPDSGDQVASWDWTITSTDPGQPTITKSGQSVTIPGYATPQTLTIALDIKDTHNLPASASTTYFIKTARSCSDNTVPIAGIAGGNQSRSGGVNSTIHFALDGNASTDAETDIETYIWTCGNGTAPSGTGPNVTCDYVVAATSQTYTVQLQVKDQGFGLPDMECQAISQPASVTITISPTTTTP